MIIKVILLTNYNMWNGFKTENKLINAELKEFWPTAMSATQEPKGFFTTDGTVKFEPDIRQPTIETDPSGKPLNTPGAKADAGKLRPWLVLGSFSHALEEVSKVGTAGAKKYTPNGWKTVENAQERYMEAFGRHMLEIGKGNEMDDGPNGTNTHHIANMVWNLLAVLELKLSEKSNSKA